MTFDSVRGVTVLFGGLGADGTGLTDTWEWNGSNWNQILPAHQPPPRWESAMVFDSTRGVSVLFGGTPATSYVGSDDLWEWNGHDWIEHSPVNPPPGRWAHAMAYDTLRRVVVLFGGASDGGGTLNDTWEWDGANWRERLPLAPPDARLSPVMAYDAALQMTYLFGGLNIDSTDTGSFPSSTWEWDGMTWKELALPAAPPGRFEACAAYDSSRHVTVLFGGNLPTQVGPPFDDTWEWDGVLWEQASGAAPPARHASACAFDSWRNVEVLFGGDEGPLGDTWERSTRWQKE